MAKTLILVIGTVAALSAPAITMAQETAAPGAERVEIGVMPAGGTFFNSGSDSKTQFGTYSLGANVVLNANRFLGVEGEVGTGVGVNQTINIQQVPFQNTKGPNTLEYNGNLVVYPGGRDRAWVPYFTGGGGGLTLFARDELAPLGLTRTETFPTANIGAGLKWWSSDNWGVRGDYRFTIVKGRESVGPFFGLDETQHAHRISASFLYTFGRQ